MKCTHILGGFAYVRIVPGRRKPTLFLTDGIEVPIDRVIRDIFSGDIKKIEFTLEGRKLFLSCRPLLLT